MKTNKKTLKIVGIIVGIVAVIAIVAVIGIMRLRNSINSLNDYTFGLTAFTLSEQDLSESVSTTGSVTSASVYEVALQTDAAATVKELNVSVGDRVQAGDVLLVLDGDAIREQIAELEKSEAEAKRSTNGTISRAQRDYNNSVTARDNAKAAYEASVASLNNLTGAYNTALGIINDLVARLDTNGDGELSTAELGAEAGAAELYSSASESVSAYVSAQAAVDAKYSEWQAAESATTSAKDQVDIANEGSSTSSNSQLTALYRQLENLTIVSEQAGIVTQLNVSKGSMASGTIMKIEDPDSLKVTVNIKEKDIFKVEVGQSVIITSDSMGSDVEFKGTVDKVINFATSGGDASSGTSSSGYTATISVEPGSNLLLGMNVKVNILLSQESNKIAVPYDAISDDGDGEYIYKAIMNDDGTYNLEKVMITRGISNEFYVEILGADLEVGDTIISYPYMVTDLENVTVELYSDDVQIVDTVGANKSIISRV